jgi:two-component system, OmpR family, sensor kinase
VRLFQRFSIRWRISLGSLLIALLLLSVAVVVFRGQVESILNSTTLTLLTHDAAPPISEVKANPQVRIDEPGRGQLVAVVDPNDVVVQTTLPKSLQKKMSYLLTLGEHVKIVHAGDDDYRILVQTVETTFGDWRVISARNDESTMLLLDRLTQALIVGALVLVLGFGIASWLLTGAALRPVTRMRQQAEAIFALGSTQPLPTGPARDELAALGATLNEFIADVRKSVERERQLVSDASHELRSPLAVLMTQLELAHLNSGDADALEHEIFAAQRSVKRLSALATSLLELSQIESQTREGESSWAALADELAAAVDQARLVAVGAKISIDFDVARFAGSAKLPTAHYAIEASNFARLVGNLTSNAIAAMPKGGTVQISLKQSPTGLTLTVVDDGPGMPTEFIPIAFDRFSRPDDSRARNSGGAGLGLAIVHAIVASANGEISIANRRSSASRATAKSGLIVIISLPRKGINRPVPV